ncbi:MAG: Arc family DNA-binding protein, partial [Saprospiraceae bacterium]|nr:Arc family DNA-binding protein [Saprospiraceae bacterium]
MNLTVRNIPDHVMNKLRKLAKMARRSLNNEILIRLEESVAHEPETAVNDVIKRQIKELRKLAGKWIDDRPTDEIIAGIYSHRTPG